MQVQNQARGIFGIVEQIGLGNALTGKVVIKINVRVIGERTAFVCKQFLAQTKHPIRLANGLVDTRVGDVRRQPGRLRSAGPVLQPRIHDSFIHDARLDIVARRKTGTPGGSAVFKRLRIFVE